jgi:DtxR family Mn-dependent transcriptional regulator
LDLSEDAEEILEALWTNAEEEGKSRFTLKSIEINRKNDFIKELTKHKLITLSENYVSLTSLGLSEAENVVRRHRLAERLLVDVLDIEEDLVEEVACKFEHVIQKGVEDSICVLLGHPRVCPHGSPIPKGKCCLKGLDKASRIVVPLSQLEQDQAGRIAYIHTKGRGRLQKLMAMGITPGMQLQVIQKFPSHVFQIGQTQIAVDEEIANEIFVLLTNSSG